MEKVVTTSKKNQITIPSWARKYLGIQAHSQLKLSSEQHSGKRYIAITTVPKESYVNRIWDKIDRNTKRYGSDDTPEINGGPDMNSGE